MARVSYRGSSLWGEAHAAQVLSRATRRLQRRHGEETRQLPALAVQRSVEGVVQQTDRLKTAGTGTRGGVKVSLIAPCQVCDSI